MKTTLYKPRGNRAKGRVTMFGECIDLLYFLTLKPIGMTVGELQKAMPHKTRGQLERVLKQLIMGGFVSVEKVFYRPNKDKNMYRIEKKAIDCMRSVLSSWKQSAHQLKMFEKESEVSQ